MWPTKIDIFNKFQGVTNISLYLFDNCNCLNEVKGTKNMRDIYRLITLEQ